MLPFCRHISISMSRDLSVSPETSSRILSQILWFTKYLEVRGSAICFAKFLSIYISIYYLSIYFSLHIFLYIISIYKFLCLSLSLSLYIYTPGLELTLKCCTTKKREQNELKSPPWVGFFPNLQCDFQLFAIV